ncbi:MAG: serine/threonine protein kinase [Cytophagales bacterium]|nr:MAG: serine/threonine protein kinase [Cytophagales bacterium]
MPTVSFNTNFPGYDVLGEINRSNARVLKARHVATGDLVAIKHFSLNTDADTLRRFERESQIMTQLAHPNIVKVREVRLDADLPYLVMDFVEGGSLRQLLKLRNHLPTEVVIRLGLQMLEVFRLIHAQGIVHRDIKPENILYHQLASGELNFLLTDFGVARLHEQPVTVTGQSLMTYEYAAPEQFDNPRLVGETADYYALGVVLYECLTGRVPFVLHNEGGLVTFMNTVLTMPPPPPVVPSGEPLPASLRMVLDKLLIKDPQERLHNPTAVKLGLKQAEIEELNAQQIPTVPNQTVPFRTAPSSSAKPIEGTDREVRGAKQPDTPSPKRSVWPMAVLGVTLLLTSLWAYWYFADGKPGTTRKSANPLSVIIGNSTETTELSDLTVEQTTRKQEQDEEKRRRKAEEQARLAAEAARKQYQDDVENARRELEATTFSGKVGLFGGVKDLKVKVHNPTNVAFKQIAVEVIYIKDNGETFKSPIMYFNNIGSGGSLTRTAPDSQRGTKFRARVLRADAVPYTADGLDSTTSQTP